MITYEWNCRTVDVYPQNEGETNVVYNVHWAVVGISQEADNESLPITAFANGTQLISVNTEVEFIPFEDLTNEIVVEWTKNAMDEEQIQSIEDVIASKIAELKNPISITMTIE
jgi:hypothetical protein